MEKFEITIRDKDDKPVEVIVNVTRLARQTGYSVSHISRVMRRETQPSVECLVALASALGLSIDKLHTMIKEREIRVADS